MSDVRTADGGVEMGWRISTPGQEIGPISEKTLKPLGSPKKFENAATSNANYCKQKMSFALRVRPRFGWRISTFLHPTSTPALEAAVFE